VAVGALAAVAVAGGASAYAATDGSGSASASPGGVNAVAAASSGKAAGKASHHRRWRARRVARAMGIHGEATTRNAKTGAYVAHEWQRGRITAVHGSDVTVRSMDGTTWTWVAGSSTKVTRDRRSIAESALKTGDKVFVLGKKSGSANDATRILAPQKKQAADGS
jgi:hypothetical protein